MHKAQFAIFNMLVPALLEYLEEYDLAGYVRRATALYWDFAPYLCEFSI